MKIVTAVDFETTKAVPRRPAQPWQIGIAQLSENGVIPGSLWHSYLRISKDDKFHPNHTPDSIQQSALATAPSFHELLPGLIRGPLAQPLAAHNGAVERTILRRAAPAHDFSITFDTLQMARRCYPALPSYALDDLVSVLGIGQELSRLCPGLEPHHAMRDAAACALLLHRMHRDFRVLDQLWPQQ